MNADDGIHCIVQRPAVLLNLLSPTTMGILETAENSNVMISNRVLSYIYNLNIAIPNEKNGLYIQPPFSARECHIHTYGLEATIHNQGMAYIRPQYPSTKCCLKKVLDGHSIAKIMMGTCTESTAEIHFICLGKARRRHTNGYTYTSQPEGA